MILAAEVAAPAEEPRTLRSGDLTLDPANIEAALDQSLQRLQTDYIDIYQPHWTDRSTHFFDALGYSYPEHDVTAP